MVSRSSTFSLKAESYGNREGGRRLPGDEDAYGVSGDEQRWTEQGLAAAEAAPDGMNMASRRTTNPEIRTVSLGTEMPATTITVPASERAGRGYFRAVRARRITPMIMSSAPVRSHQRIRPGRADRVISWTPGRPARVEDEDHTTTMVRRRDRSLTAASRTHESALEYSMLRFRASPERGH